MPKQCRICFEEGGELVSPCACSGTSKYIHTECLKRYIRFFPDGMCRVCNQYLDFESLESKAFFIFFFSFMVVLWFLMDVFWVSKIVLLFCFGLLILTYRLRHSFDNLFASILMFFVLTMVRIGYQFRENSQFIIFVWIIFVLYTMFHYINPYQLLKIFTILTCGLYMTIFAIASMGQMDIYGASFTIVLMIMIWNLWMQTHPRLDN